MRRMAALLFTVAALTWSVAVFAEDSDDEGSGETDFAVVQEPIPTASTIPMASFQKDNVTLELMPVKAVLSISF